MRKLLFAGAGAAALVSAACATTTQEVRGAAQDQPSEPRPSPPPAQPAPAANPLLAKWSGPYGGVPAVRPGQGRALQARARGGDGAEPPRDRRHRERPGRAHLREHHRRARGRGADPQRRRHDLRHLELDHERPGVPGRRARDGAQARRLLRRDHPEREALPAHRGGLRLAREGEADARAAAPRLAALHELRPRGREARRGGEEAPGRASTSASPRSTPTSARTCWPTRRATSSSSRRRRTSPACPTPSAPARRPRPRRAA